MLLGIILNKSLFDWPLTQAHAQPSTAFSILATGSRVFQDALCSRRNLGQACFFPKATVRYSNMKALQTSTLSHRNDYNKAHLLCSSPRLLLLQHKTHVAELGFPGLFYSFHLFYNILTFRFSFAEGLRIFAHLAQQTLKSYKFHN